MSGKIYVTPDVLARGAAQTTKTLAVSGFVKCSMKYVQKIIILNGKRLRSLYKPAKTKNDGCFKSVYSQFIAGAIAGGGATYSTHWLDTVKVRMQTSPGQYRCGLVCMRDILRHEGAAALYQGAVPALLGQMAKSSVTFMTYGACQEVVCKMTGVQSTHDMKVIHRASAGAMTGVAASFVLCPMEVIKCRLQTTALQQTKGASCGPVDVLRITLRTEGVRGLYRGLNGLWAKDIPGAFIYFGGYEGARSLMKTAVNRDNLGKGETFLCGMTAGVAYCVMHPLESVKTRVQVATVLTSGDHSAAPTRPPGFCRSVITIIKQEGMRPLWSGLKPCMIRASLYSGIQFLIFEMVKEKIMGPEQTT